MTLAEQADAERQEQEQERESRALQIIEGRFVEMTTIARTPVDILTDGKRAAVALFDAMKQKAKKPVMMNNERYLEFEDWSLITTFFGKAISCPAGDCRYVDLGVIEVEPGKPVRVHGFEATAYLIDIRTGRVLTSASMACLTDEPKWRSKAEYEWVDDTAEEIAGREVQRRATFPDERTGEKRRRARVKTGESPVPLFQLRSMAQTRAGSKLARMNYSWVAVLAGFSATPAEEVVPEKQEPLVDPVPADALAKISAAWKTLVSIYAKDSKAETADKAEAAKRAEGIKTTLRTLGYRGVSAKDLWADFASRGKPDVAKVNEALGIGEFDPDSVADDAAAFTNGGTPAPEAAQGPQTEEK